MKGSSFVVLDSVIPDKISCVVFNHKLQGFNSEQYYQELIHPASICITRVYFKPFYSSFGRFLFQNLFSAVLANVILMPLLIKKFIYKVSDL